MARDYGCDPPANIPANMRTMLWVLISYASSRLLGRIGHLEYRMLCWLRDRILNLVHVEVQLRQMERSVGHEA
jgi:hypothetical protein